MKTQTLPLISILLNALNNQVCITDNRKDFNLKDFLNKPYIKECKANCKDQGLKPTIGNIVESGYDDFKDDFQNCGGDLLHRFGDIMQIWAIASAEQKDLIHRDILHRWAQYTQNP